MSKTRLVSKKALFGLLIFFSIFAFFRNFTYLFVDFSVNKIQSDFSFHAEWESHVPLENPQEVERALNQPYRYLATGAQSYAFSSRDGKYVIKFFRMKHLFPPKWKKYSLERLAEYEKNLASVFSAYKQAYEELKEETGLVFIHLNKTQVLNKRLIVVDRLGGRYEVDLDQTEFIIQKKAELVFDRFKRLYKEGKQEEIKSLAESLLKMIRFRLEKGFSDLDLAVSHNYGFIGSQPIQIDVGRITKTKRREGEYERISERLRSWLKQRKILISDNPTEDGGFFGPSGISYNNQTS